MRTSGDVVSVVFTSSSAPVRSREIEREQVVQRPSSKTLIGLAFTGNTQIEMFEHLHVKNALGVVAYS